MIWLDLLGLPSLVSMVRPGMSSLSGNGIAPSENTCFEPSFLVRSILFAPFMYSHFEMSST